MTDLSFVLLYVENPTVSAGFYERLFGRAPVESSPTFVMFKAGPAHMLGMWTRDGVATPAGAPGGSEIAIAVANDAAVDAMHASWREGGVKILQEPLRMDFGRTFTGADPDGHRLRVFAPG